MFYNRHRYQKGLTISQIFPSVTGVCACGCGTPLTGRKLKWASSNCRDKSFIRFAIIKGDTKIIRTELFKRDRGICINCGNYDPYWQADHIIPVSKGGGGTGLENFQTLCIECHKLKTYRLSHRNAISSHAASILFNLNAYDLGAVSMFKLNASNAIHIL